MKQKVRISFLLNILAVMLFTTVYAQPVPVTQIPAGSHDFTSVGGLVYFEADNSLYRTDGTEDGTILLANVTANDFREFRDEVYFIANGPRDTKELWKSDGTPSGTVPLGAYYTMTFMGQTEDYLFFAAALDGTGRELYRTNGESGGTILLKDIYPGPENGLSDNALFYSEITRKAEFPAAVLGDELIFAGEDGVNGIELWKSDGTPSGTVLVEDINAGAADGFLPGRAVTFEGYVYFRGRDVASGAELWRTDGSASGTSLFHDVVPGPNPSLLDLVPPHDGNLYFSSRVPESGGDAFDLWRTDGTSTFEIKRLCQDCRFDRFFVDFNNRLYFFIYQEYARNVLWGTDGTTAGTTKLYDEFHDGEIPFFDAVGDYMIFYNTSQGHNLDLHRTQGEPPTPFWRFNSAGQLSALISMATVGDLLFFADHAGPSDSNGQPNDPEDAFQLMQTDGVTVQALRDIFGVSFRLTSNITNYMDRLVFTTAGDEGQLTLWVYNPQEEVATFTVVNADTNEDIKTLLEGEVFVKPEDLNINIRYNPVGDPARVVFKHQDKTVRSESEAPYALRGDYSGDYLVWEGATEGEHKIEAIEYNASNEAGASLTVTFTIQTDAMCTAEGIISYEKWNGIQGNEVSRIPVNSAPSTVSTLSSFEAPSNQGHNYGARISGYICVPASGNYTFWIASNDHSELWLSTDDDPENKQRIAWLARATDPQQWNKFTTQKSAPVWLEQGQRYYVEALHKQGIGGDHLAVGWQLPDGTMERPIAGSRLSPFQATDNATARIATNAVEESGGLFEQISIYPNPATTGAREIMIGGYEGIDQNIETKVEIVNLTGEVVFSDRVSCGGDCGSYVLQVNEGLTPGIYMINLQTDKTRTSKRLLVK